MTDDLEKRRLYHQRYRRLHKASIRRSEKRWKDRRQMARDFCRAVEELLPQIRDRLMFKNWIDFEFDGEAVENVVGVFHVDWDKNISGIAAM